MITIQELMFCVAMALTLLIVLYASEDWVLRKHEEYLNFYKENQNLKKQVRQLMETKGLSATRDVAREALRELEWKYHLPTEQAVHHYLAHDYIPGVPKPDAISWCAEYQRYKNNLEESE